MIYVCGQDIGIQYMVGHPNFPVHTSLIYECNEPVNLDEPPCTRVETLLIYIFCMQTYNLKCLAWSVINCLRS